MLPKHILKSAEKNLTSLGDNPCLPPEEETNFIVNILTRYYDKLTDGKDINEQQIQEELKNLIVQCQKLEKENVNALEKICFDCIDELFEIPEDTIEIEGKLVSKIDNDNERLVPEKIEDFSFDSIDDMNNLSSEIYKRRMLNCLIAGASMYYMKNFKPYFQKIFEINPDLPALYKKILNLNDILLYLSKDKLSDDNNDGGKVDVNISSGNNMVSIKAEALLFPILLNEIIKGILELAISHGLPKNREKAMYVIGKSDFKLAEVWDMRIGCPLWEIIVSLIDELGYNAEEIGINFIMMSFAVMDCNEFNEKMKEILAKTKRGKEIMNEILVEIIHNKEQDEFDDFITQMNDKPQLTDDDFYEADELLTDAIM